MRTREVLLAAALCLPSLAVTTPALAQDDDPGPMGAPQMPAGHPPVNPQNPHGAGGRGGGGMPGVFTPPEDTEMEDPTAPPGTIVVELRDADDHPIAGETITLGILINSIAKGDSRNHVQAVTDAGGRVTFKDLQTQSNIAYRVSCGYQGGAFAAMPFQLQQAKSMHVVLHVYPVTHDIQQALIVGESTLATELKDDRLQIEEVLTVYNLGKTAWQPLDVKMKLPEGATAFSAQTTMSDQGVDEIGGQARLRGTFPPGRHTVEFRWQLPWSNTADVAFSVGLPPHAAISRVMIPAAGDMKLTVAGFPAPQLKRDQQGQGFLITEKRLTPDDPRLASLDIALHDLPTAGPGRIVATVLAAFGVLVGIALAMDKRAAGPAGAAKSKSARAALLEELAELERGRASGEVGPKTYERTRRELIDALARVLAEA